MVEDKEKIICPNCGDVVVEDPGCDSMGIITCDNCDEQIFWKSKSEEN